jgi:hypothetical protein
LRILWNPELKLFELEFSKGSTWAEDQQLAKDAKFKASPPEWIWRTHKVEPLLYLKKHTPSSGLLISPEALTEFTKLKESYDRNQEVIKQLKDAQKEAKKELEQKARELAPDDPIFTIYGEGGIILREGISSSSSLPVPSPRPKIILKPEETCIICGFGPLSPLDYGVICLWCSKENK